ncbi:hypothetical protein [Winogradskyella flava]|uniref:Uncharacterized protein n=1 Tax=Winogradskyella flava TaxID=1884876 RepID=A0A842IV88_9FLAO|nr:hypothetical protein [Winogradskyella flava]MBC2845844.1 hypothetical protein [Winogradskyella flava]
MKTKTFVVAGLVGGIVDWLLGWLFYGILFVDTFPQPQEGTNAMLFITLGCLAFGFFISYIFNKWAQITTLATGAKAGAIIGLFMGLITIFFGMANQAEVDYQRFGLELVISIVMAAVVGAVVGLINGKVK